MQTKEDSAASRSFTMLVKFPRLLALLSVFATVSASLVFHEARTAPPNGFVSKGPAPAYQSIELRIGLTSNNINGLQSKLMSISTPGSEDFRQWLSAGESSLFILKETLLMLCSEL